MCTRAASTGRPRYSTVMVQRIMSASAPAVSTPVAPPPTTTKLSAPRSTSEGSRSAASNTLMRRDRNRWASSREYSGKEWRSAPGVPKKFGTDPAASTTASPVQLSPSVAVTVHVAGSIDATSAILMLTLRRLWKTLRSETAMLLVPSCEVATWYSSGWNWW